MKVRIPRADAVAIGAAISALIALAQETTWEHWIKQTTIIVGGLLLALFIYPVTTEEPVAGPPETARTPEAPPVKEEV